MNPRDSDLHNRTDRGISNWDKALGKRHVPVCGGGRQDDELSFVRWDMLMYAQHTGVWSQLKMKVWESSAFYKCVKKRRGRQKTDGWSRAEKR